MTNERMIELIQQAYVLKKDLSLEYNKNSETRELALVCAGEERAYLSILDVLKRNNAYMLVCAASNSIDTHV